MHTIWGPAQSARQIIPGVGIVSTASHGGLIISESRRLMLPEYMRLDGDCHSYEEDTAWSIIFVAFEEELLAGGDEHTVRTIQEGHHTDTLRSWHPTIYEKHFGVTIPPGGSIVKDERTFLDEHADDLIVVAAFGDWHENILAGMVGVVARLGRNKSGSDEAGDRYFLVGADEYKGGSQFGFIIDLTRHEEIERFC